MSGFGKVKALRVEQHAYLAAAESTAETQRNAPVPISDLQNPWFGDDCLVISESLWRARLRVTPFQSVSPIAFAVIVPLLLLAGFCMFYTFYSGLKA